MSNTAKRLGINYGGMHILNLERTLSSSEILSSLADKLKTLFSQVG
jgi:hypothetical protein